MKNILIMSVLITLISSFAGCSYFKGKVIPAAKKSVAEKLTKAIVKVGECSNYAEVQNDVYNLLKLESDDGVVVKAMAFEAPAEGDAKNLTASKSIIGDVCKAAANLAIPALLKKGVPEKWECKLNDLSERSKELADKACSKL